MQLPQLHEPDLHPRIHLMRTRPGPIRPIGQPVQPARGIPAQPGMQPLPRHPDLRRHIGHRQAVLHDSQDRLITLLDHGELPEHTGHPASIPTTTGTQ
jgi:hypothetical protein